MHVPSLGQEDPLEEGMTTHSSILAWRIPWTEKPGGLQCWRKSDTTEETVCVRVRTRAHTHTHTHTLLYGFSRFLTHLTLELSSLKVHLKCSLYSLKVALNSYSFQNQEAQKPWCPLPWGKRSIRFCNNHFLDFLEFYNPYVYVLVAQSCSTCYNPMNCSLSGSSVHGILKARILEWVAISFSRRSSQPRDQTQVSHIAGRFFMI